MTDTSIDPRYPIGKFERPTQPLGAAARSELIDVIAAAPARLREAVAGLTDAQLDTPYREGGWTLRQVVHHLPDSHMNAYVRTKLALTEDEPSVSGYDEAAWAKLRDSRDTPIETSLALLTALHERWVLLLRSISDADFARGVRHPERGLMTLDTILGIYAWHGRHHVAHVTTTRAKM